MVKKVKQAVKPVAVVEEKKEEVEEKKDGKEDVKGNLTPVELASVEQCVIDIKSQVSFFILQL